jgi:hypothetical protein
MGPHTSSTSVLIRKDNTKKVCLSYTIILEL